MSYNNDPSGRMVNGTYHSNEQLRTSGVSSTDSNAVAAIKLEQARMSQQEHDNRKRQQEYVPLGHVEDMRSQYQKALSKAKIQNAMRLVLILMAPAVLFFALNTTIGENIRDNSLYGVKDKYSFSPMEVGLYGSGVSVSPALKQRGADDFQRRFGRLEEVTQLQKGCYQAANHRKPSNTQNDWMSCPINTESIRLCCINRP